MDKLKVVYKNIDDIIPYANNPRNNVAGIDKVAASIKEFGFNVPIILDGNNEIIAGHTRILAAKQLGLRDVPCVVAGDLTPAQVKAFRIADNKVAEFSSWNEDLLNIEFDALKEMDFDLSLTGFDSMEIGEITDHHGEGVKEDNFDIEKALSESPVSKPGDIWVAGKHRIMCGDSTNQADVSRLMGGQLADMIFTDPPYNVDYQGGTKDKLTIQNDNMPADEFYKFLFDAFSAMLAATKPGGQYMYATLIQRA